MTPAAPSRKTPAVAICTAQTLFVQGGAELLVRSLERELRAREYTVEVVRLPFTWAKADLLQNALLWRLLRVEADRVVATNFPSYFVKHHNKGVWLFHQHRKLYELYGTRFSEFGSEPADEEVRSIVVAADTKFLSEARRVFTISRNVSQRLARFNGVDGRPLYHPPPLYRSLACGDYGDFVLMPTRLESHKRPALLIDALRLTRSGVRAVVAGQGPLIEALRRQVAEHGLASRVQIAGYVDEATLVELYARCAMVFYTPFDEDYGYVPLEAFWARKPVVTTSDSGGVLEFVVDEETGLVAAPDAGSLAACIDRLAESGDLCRRLGNAGHARVQGISWDDVVPKLVEDAS